MSTLRQEIKTIPLQLVTEEVLEEMVQAIVSEVHPVRIVLFGSRVRGESNEISDVDLLIVVSELANRGARREYLSRIRRVLAHYLFPIDLLVYSEAEHSRLSKLPGHVVATAIAEGTVLYERV